MAGSLLMDAGHDNGLIVFKLERERPAFSLSGNQLFYMKDKIIRMADLTAGTNQGICSVRKLGSPWAQPKTLSYNPAERAVIVTSVSYSTPFCAWILTRARPPRMDNTSLSPCRILLRLLPEMARIHRRMGRRERE